MSIGEAKIPQAIGEVILETTPQELEAYADELIARHVDSVLEESRQQAISTELLVGRGIRRAVYEALGLSAPHDPSDTKDTQQ